MMRKVSVFFCLIVMGLFLSNCATVVSLVTEGGLDQEISFDSNPPGVQILQGGGLPLGVTPLTVKIERSKSMFILAKKEGYEDQSIRLAHHFNYWFWGGIICCGLLGSTTDMADDAVIKYDPTKYFITMNPKNASIEQQQQFGRTKTARSLMLVGYSTIRQNLASGHGEYLSSLLAALNVSDSGKDQAVGKLQTLALETHDALEFSNRVLEIFPMSSL
jgi:hypothetical protein